MNQQVAHQDLNTKFHMNTQASNECAPQWDSTKQRV